MERGRGWVTTALVAVIVVLLLTGAAGPGRGMREDIAALARISAAQREIITRQETLLRDQTAISREMSRKMDALVALTRSTSASTSELGDVIRRIERLMKQLLAEVRDMNRRTGGGVTPSVVP